MNIEEHKKRILDIFKRYKKKIIDIEEFQAWVQTLLLEEFIGWKNKEKFYEELELIRFYEPENLQYNKVMNKINDFFKEMERK